MTDKKELELEELDEVAGGHAIEPPPKGQEHCWGNADGNTGINPAEPGGPINDDDDLTCLRDCK